MLADDPPVLADHDAIRIGLDLDRAADRARGHRIFVVVEAHQAGLGDRCRHCMEAIEPARIGHKLRPLGLKNLPDRLAGQLRMMMRLGVGDAFVGEPGVQLVVALEPQSRCKEPLTHEADLILDLPLLPARCRDIGHR
jgi:hypothetical protein